MHMNKREKSFADSFFGGKGWKFQFQPRTFVLNGIKYTPDFYDVERDVYIEVVGSRQAYHQNKAKYELMKIFHPEVSLELRHHTGGHYTPSIESNKSFLKNNTVNLKSVSFHQSNVAKAIGISVSALSMILNGKRGIGAKTALRMAAATGKPVEFFLTAEPVQILNCISGVEV